MEPPTAQAQICCVASLPAAAAAGESCPRNPLPSPFQLLLTIKFLSLLPCLGSKSPPFPRGGREMKNRRMRRSSWRAAALTEGKESVLWQHTQSCVANGPISSPSAAFPTRLPSIYQRRCQYTNARSGAGRRRSAPTTSERGRRGMGGGKKTEAAN